MRGGSSAPCACSTHCSGELLMFPICVTVCCSGWVSCWRLVVWSLQLLCLFGPASLLLSCFCLPGGAP